MATGFTIAQAKSLMTMYLNSPISLDSSGNYHGTLPGSPEIHSNCTLFSTWFLLNYTTDNVRLAILSGNGNQMVEYFVNANIGKVSIRNTPVAFSLFSITANNGNYYTMNAGHTGIVLGIDGDTVITGEANYNAPFGGLDAPYPNNGTVVRTYPLSTFNSSTGVTFVDLNNYLKDELKLIGREQIIEEEQDMFTFDCNGTVFLKQGDRAKWFNDSKKLAKLREEYKRVYGKDLMNIGTVDAKQRDEFTR
ncbi:hypothetical protein BG261_08275 [Floricoccus tropicus]|uniref:Uncharacterized protein n=1 Tax=Floricoccus tropicus TaxID=1859473 RepID=A0A1E8GJ25_9LACT|nr:CHAP domain-containing protein [Floricoccus tropicus]OFI48270.1 hypothetical protein BG261_08275 [Floricoccus tropicus]